MTYLTYFLTGSMILIMLSGCHKTDQGFKRHPSGLSYRFYDMHPEGAVPEQGDILVLSLKMFTADNKLFDESTFYRLQLGAPIYQGDFYTGLALLQVGDSACFKLDAFAFFEKTRKRGLPDDFQQGAPIYIHVRLKNILTTKEMEDERASIYHTDREQEMSLLKDYLKITNTTATPTASGLYYIERKKGIGKIAEPGNTLVVHYTGKTIDGKVFDSSLTRGTPLTFVLGRGQVIKGWDEGFALLREGGEARLIIPSDLAYGKEGYSGIILPYSTLVFDVELIEIK